MKFAAIFAAFLLVVLAPSYSLRAQGVFGSISGVVTDSSGAVVPSATVKVTNVDTNVVTTLTTNGSGVYVANSLNPGNYKVQAEAKGFSTAQVNNVLLEVNSSPKVDVRLSVGQSNQVIEAVSYTHLTLPTKA